MLCDVFANLFLKPVVTYGGLGTCMLDALRVALEGMGIAGVSGLSSASLPWTLSLRTLCVGWSNSGHADRRRRCISRMQPILTNFFLEREEATG